MREKLRRNMKNVTLGLLVLFLSTISFVQSKKPPQLLDATLAEINSGLTDGEFTSVDLVKAYIARIQEVNSTLHVVTELNPDALEIAKQRDKERSEGLTRGRLHGIPILIKGNIGTDDKMNTTAGSYALLGAKLPRDSTVAAKLRQAGAIILGKTNLSQWANYRSTNSSNGWSAYGGQCFGAYYPKQDPSGSSSGSGVGTSLGLSVAALGTETDGSIVSPSEMNNIVGLKPTVGLTSRYLVVPISQHQDSVGPMARTVRDAAALLQVIAGYDPHDNYTSAIPDPENLPDYVAACNAGALKGARLGLPENVLEGYARYLSKPVSNAFTQAVNLIKEAGATIVTSNFTAFDEFENSNNETIVLNADFITDLKVFFSELTYNPQNIHDLAELTRFTKTFPIEDFPSRNVGVFTGALKQGYGNTDPRAMEAYQADLYLGGEGGLLGAIKRHNLDAVLLPTDISSSFAAIVGAPLITVPMGFYPKHQPVQKNARGNLVAIGPNIPFGISFLGKKFSEAGLLSYAYAYEQMTHVREQEMPYITPTAEISDFT